VAEQPRMKMLWNYEYLEGRVIPSTTREAPSHALVLFEELLGFANMTRALDAGCSNGRNSLYLASLGLRVDSLDISSVALTELRNRIRISGLMDRICVHECNLEDALPFKPESFDLCLDFYIFCHFLDERVKRQYVAELWRVTKPGGYTLSTVFPPWDGYYGRLTTTGREPIIVKDPANGIVKELYTKENFNAWFAPPFMLRYFIKLEFEDMVQGKLYHRDILAMAVQKPK